MPLLLNNEDVIVFPNGVPAFEHEKSFVLLQPPATSPVIYMQSAGNPALRFLALPVQTVAPDYRTAIIKEDLETLELDPTRQPDIGSEILCLALIAVDEHGVPTANLMAPITVNVCARRGVQAIRADSLYSHQHPLRPAPVSDAAGAPC